jgi:hypothetical protein
LPPRAFDGENLDARLDEAARAFVNHPRAVRFEGERLVVSSIYKWYMTDFGGDEAGVIAHLKQYAGDDLRARLDAAAGIDKFEYDWSLNGGAQQQPATTQSQR